MQKWEYQIHRFNFNIGDEAYVLMMQAFNDLGKEGWEAYNIDKEQIGSMVTIMALFKRPLE